MSLQMSAASARRGGKRGGGGGTNTCSWGEQEKIERDSSFPPENGKTAGSSRKMTRI